MLAKVRSLWRQTAARDTRSGPLPREAETDRAVHELSQALNLIADVEPLVGEELGKLRQVLGAERLVLLIADEEEGPYRVRGQRGLPTAVDREISLERGSRLAGWLVTNEAPLVLAARPGVVDYLGEEEAGLLRRLGADVVVPLTAANRLVGLLTVGRAGECTRAELDLLTRIGPRLGLALQNALLLRQSRLRLRRLYRTERLATVGQLAAGAAHEIRNPLTGIRSTIQYLRRDYEGDADKRELVDELIAEVDRIDQIIAGLLAFARPSEPTLESVDLAELLRQTSHLLDSAARKARVRVVLDLDETGGQVEADPAQLKQVFLNLFLNAIQGMPEGGTLTVALIPWQDGCQVEVSDTGVGIPEADLERVFDPFYTTKEEGTGLGLATCYGIVTRHGGQLDLTSVKGQGTRATVRLHARVPGSPAR